MYSLKFYHLIIADEIEYLNGHCFVRSICALFALAVVCKMRVAVDLFIWMLSDLSEHLHSGMSEHPPEWHE